MIKTIQVLLLFVILSPCVTGRAETLDWNDCVSLALKRNPSLKIAQENIKQKKADTGLAVSPLLPQTSTSVSADWGKNAGEKSTHNSYSVNARQLIFDGMKGFYDVRAAKVITDAANYEYQVTESNLRLALRTAFVNLLAAQENLALSEKIALRRKENYNLVRVRYEAGLENKGSLLTARASLVQAEADFRDSGRQLVLAQRAVIKEIGMEERLEIIAKGELALREQGDSIPDFSAIAGTTPFLLQMAEMSRSAQYQAYSSGLAFFPSVYAFFNAGKNRTTQGRADIKSTELGAGIEMTYPISDGGERFNNAMKANSVSRQAQEEFKSTKLDILYTLEEKWNAFQYAREQVEVARMFLEAAQERSKIAEAQYSIGLITFNNWTIIEDELVQYNKNYLKARSQALLAEAEWVQAKGGTFSYDR